MLSPRVALLVGAAFFSVPALAQDTPQQVTPPPIMVAPAPAPAPAQPQVVMQPSAPVVQSVPSVEEQQRGVAARDAPAPAERRAAPPARAARNPAPVRAAQPAPAAPAAPVSAEPAAPAAPVAQTPPPAAAPQPPVAAPAPEAAPVTVTDSAAEQSRSTGIAWPWLLGGALLVLAGLAVILFGRRRRVDEPAYVDETRSEPVAREPVIEPVAAPETAFVAPEPAPVVAASYPEPVAAPEVVAANAAAETIAEPEVEAEIAEADDADLAGVIDTPAPVSRRPWIELAMKPVRAGTSEEEALVDFELTVGNSGDTPARDVRISSFMLAEPEGTEMEQLLMEHRDDTIVPPITIPAGDGTRVDAHLAVPKDNLGRTFNPVVVAEARYTLPDGSEARTAAAFRIGRPAYEGGIGAIGSSRPHVVEDLAAELYGTPEHA